MESSLTLAATHNFSYTKLSPSENSNLKCIDRFFKLFELSGKLHSLILYFGFNPLNGLGEATLHRRLS